jgi:hypothetical protein
MCVKRDLVCIKRDLLCVKRDLVCVSSIDMYNNDVSKESVINL